VPTFKLKESFLAARGEFLPHPETVKDLKEQEATRDGEADIILVVFHSFILGFSFCDSQEIHLQRMLARRHCYTLRARLP
jgi:hypothetical protein